MAPPSAKTACAIRLMRQDGETRTLYIDDFNGQAHKTYGGMPNAGKGSALDFFKGLPYLIWVHIVKRNLKLLFGRETGFSADTRC